MKELTLRIAVGTDAPRVSRSLAAEMRPHVGSRFDDILLILSELVTNSVRHATDTDEVLVSIRATEDNVRLEVTDRGQGFAPSSPTRGKGLHIVDRLADRWGVSVDDACTVWVELRDDREASRC